MQMMLKAYLQIALLALGACTTTTQSTPTKYVRKTECHSGDRVQLQQECGYGYSEVMTDENVYVVSFEGNSSTSLERTTDFAILRCAQIAKDRVSLDIAVYITETGVFSATDEYGNDSNLPRTSVECEILENLRRADSLTVESVETKMREKYPQELL